MTKSQMWAGVLGIFTGLMINVMLASAESNVPERSKSGNDLVTSLNGTDVYQFSISQRYDAGSNNAKCVNQHINGWNMMVWCDGAAYVSNTTTGVDGGALRLQEMIPLAAYEKWPMGIFGNSKASACVQQSAAQSDAGVDVECNFFRRY